MRDVRLVARSIVRVGPGSEGSSGAEPIQIMGESLAISGGKVIESAEEPESPEIELADDIVLPGLVNGHDHLQLNGAPELKPVRRFQNAAAWIDWFNEAVGSDPTSPRYPPGLAAPLELRLWQGALKNILSGATTVAHHDPLHEVMEEPGFPVRIAAVGWAHSLDLAGRYGPSFDQSFRETPKAVPWVIHLAEGVDARAEAEFRVLDSAGCVDHRTVAVHAVGLSAEDRRQFLGLGGAAVWCPASNLAILGTTLNPAQWSLGTANHHERICLGTDSRLSGSNDLLKELRIAVSVGKISPAAAARMVTVNAAKILRLPHAGTLGPGSPADLVVVKASDDPWRDLVASQRSDLRAVVVGGRPVITDPDLQRWFDLSGVEPVKVLLDGHQKLVSRAALGPPGAAALEPGLEVLE